MKKTPSFQFVFATVMTGGSSGQITVQIPGVSGTTAIDAVATSAHDGSYQDGDTVIVGSRTNGRSGLIVLGVLQ